MTTEAEFLRDVANHKMTVIRDDGNFRHIHFGEPGCGAFHFNVTTWPGYLCISGDMGCYVFSRLDDMFGFFRTDGEAGQLKINLGYWSEKLQATSSNGRYSSGCEEFDEEEFDSTVKKRTMEWIKETRDQTTAEDRRELWDEVHHCVIDASDGGFGEIKKAAAYEFSHRVNNAAGVFRFDDLFEYSFNKYTYHFIWCCYAIAWAIHRYDESENLSA